jgi:hypothetical protein
LERRVGHPPGADTVIESAVPYNDAIFEVKTRIPDNMKLPAGGESERDWCYPWCSRFAGLPTDFAVICESRVCECGALGLAAPSWDTDEIIDDAINVFGPIPHEYAI